MNHDPKSMTCQKFQEQFPELIGSGADLENDPHLKTCDRCRALLNDLETIADAARQLLPIQQPEDTLWDRIESAIRKEETSQPKAE
jgi:predicted anti-sigma-YlaC factor YlaD